MGSKRTTRPRNLIAAIMRVKIQSSGKTQAQIARECGLPKPNVVSMIKNGQTRLPLDRLAAFAKSVDMDVFELFSAWMANEYGQTWVELQKHVIRAPTST